MEWQPCTQLHHLIRGFYKSLPLKSWNTAVSTNISLCCEITQKQRYSCVCFCQFPCFKYLPFECCCGAVCTNMSLLILLSPNISFSCVRTEPKQQTLPFQFKQGLLTRPFFSLGGLGLCQKVCICMPNLVMLITHFGQKHKYWPSKCPSRAAAVLFLSYLLK